ncbi:putative phage abortive infection protein [Celeribacter sp.]|uniref:putative phage abortive infection protein n=1 Tax=Celeribacter sp. TaxID=1890673 RepID=UPI003A9253CE
MSEDLPKGPSRWILIGAVLFVIALWLGTVWLVPWFDRLGERGTFGDMFGAVNALFTGLAFAFVVYGLAVQRHEVKLLTEELQGTKRLAEEQQKLAKVQISAQQKQQFEATFFNLLRVFNDLVENMDLVRKTDQLRTTGRDVFPVFIDRIRTKYLLCEVGEYGEQIPLPDEAQPSSEELYDSFYSEHSSELGHYFRTLYNLFKFVSGWELNEKDGTPSATKCVLTEKEKRLYTNLIRAQLSDDEVMLLFLNGLSERGAKFKPYLEKYAVLKNVNKEDGLFTRSERKDEYAPSAFE